MIVLGAPVDSKHETDDVPGGRFELHGSGTVWKRCDVRTLNVAGPDDVEDRVLYHEMGHCLGLAHDDYPLSIMYPKQRATADKTIPPWISDSDRVLLRELYAP